MEKGSAFERKGVMIITALFCCFLWGSAFPTIKLSYLELGSLNEYQMILLAGLRFILAGVFVLAFAKLRLHTKLVPVRSEIPLLLAVALIQTFGSYVLYYIGMAHTSGVKGSILVSLSVFLVAVFAHFMFRSDRLSWKKGVGLLCGFAGVVTVNVSLLADETFSFSLQGEGLIIFHCILGAAVTVLVRKYGSKMDIVRLSGWQLAVGGMMLALVGFAGCPQGLMFNTAAVLLLIYMAGISAAAFTLWFVMLKYHKATVLEQYKFAIPLFGALLTVLLVPGEHIGPEMLAAAVLVTIGVWVVNREEKRVSV